MGLPQPQELVAAAKKKLGCRSDDDLAHALRTRYGLRPSTSTVYRWRNGTTPDGQSTLALLDAAGMLNKSGGRQKAPAAPDDHQAELAATVRELTDAQAQTLSELREFRAAVEGALERRQAPPRRKAR